MPENTVYDYSDTCAALRKAVSDLDVRIKVSEQNTKLQSAYTEKLQSLEHNIALCNGVIDILKDSIPDVKDYIARKRRMSMQNINNALRLAGEIIQDAADGIFFQLDGDEAWLSTPDGLEVDKVEGGGYRQISSTFVRSTVLNSNPNLLQTLMLDEIFSLVSQDNSATLSLYLNVICQNMQVISIEQKPQVYSNLEHYSVYSFESGDYAKVTHTEYNKAMEG